MGETFHDTPWDGGNPPDGLFDAINSDRYLGNPDTVSNEVSRFAMLVTGLCMQVDEGIGDSYTLQELTESLCRDHAAIFTGKNTHYTPVPGWNSDAGLGAKMQALLSDTSDDGAYLFFVKLAVQVIQAYHLIHNEGRDPDEVGEELSEILSDYASRLIGLDGHGRLAKSHISAYTRHDGVFVAAHEDKRHKAETPKAPPAKGGVWHPKPNDHGKPHPIMKPTNPTGPETWEDPKAVATFTPGGATPEELNGIPFAPWDDSPKTEQEWEEYAFTPGYNDDIDAMVPMFPAKMGKHDAYGAIIEEPDGRVWVVHPSNQFGGYKTTFPKGTQDNDEVWGQTVAIKEAWEESGLKIYVTGWVADVERSTSVTRYFRAVRVGGTPADMGWECQAVSLVPKDKLTAVLNQPVDHGLAAKI